MKAYKFVCVACNLEFAVGEDQEIEESELSCPCCGDEVKKDDQPCELISI